MTFLRDIRNWLFPPDTVATPLTDRARALGIPESEIDAMWEEASSFSTPEFEATRIFENMVAIWEYEHMDDVQTEDTSK